MELAIEELEWSLRGSDRSIEHEWIDVQRYQRRIEDDKRGLTEALERYTKAVNRKESLRLALEVLRAAS